MDFKCMTPSIFKLLFEYAYSGKKNSKIWEHFPPPYFISNVDAFYSTWVFAQQAPANVNAPVIMSQCKYVRLTLHLRHPSHFLWGYSTD